MSNDLHISYRPCTISELVGNNVIKDTVSNYLVNGNFPHTALFVGDAGCGKTSLARIVALSLNCENTNNGEACLNCSSCKDILNGNSFDVSEINVASSGGKAAVENIVADLASAPFKAKNKIIIFDECHELTKSAKAVLLKHAEDCYSHVYLFFVTNTPEKLQEKNGKGTPFLDRCTQFSLRPVDDDNIKSMLVNVCEFEGAQFKDNVLDYISSIVVGVPRKALVCLNQVISEGSWDLNKVKILLNDTLLDDDVAVIELSRAVFKGSFLEPLNIYKNL